MAGIRLEGVEKVFPNGHAAVRGLDLEIADGELLVLVGPSGSGKSTALRLIAGLETPTAGSILIGGRDVTDVPPQRRDLAMVFQSYALYPHKTVRGNLEFGLRARGADRATIEGRVADVAASLGIADLLDRKPAQLSGGQRQRVALGRAMVREPAAFLLDEPLSNLDPRLRVRTRAELALLHRRLAATMVHVTHDQEEAMTLGGRIAVLRAGTLQQLGPPLDLYRRPANAFVAGFIGSPSMNLVEADVLPGDDGAADLVARGLRLRLTMPPAGLPRRVLLGVRPHEVDRAGPADADLAGTVAIAEPLGHATVLHVSAADGVEAWRAVVPADATIRAGDRLGLRLRREALHFFDAATGLRLGAGPTASNPA